MIVVVVMMAVSKTSQLSNSPPSALDSSQPALGATMAVPHAHHLLTLQWPTRRHRGSPPRPFPNVVVIPRSRLLSSGTPRKGHYCTSVLHAGG